MTDQIVISLDENSDLTKEEWEEFVRGKRGKWRGVASAEGEKALNQYMESDGVETDENDEEKERLQRENERLSAENERLTEEVERLSAALEGEGSHPPTPSEELRRWKMENDESAKIASNSSNDTPADEDGDGGSWWDGYDPSEDDVTIPSDAVGELAEMEDVPRVAERHVDLDESVPYRPMEAKVALVKAMLKEESPVASEGDVLELAVRYLSGQSFDEADKSHWRGKVVEPIVDEAPVDPRSEDGERYCVSDEMYEMRQGMTGETMGMVENVVQAAQGDHGYVAEESLDWWEDHREDVLDDDSLDKMTWRIVADALEAVVEGAPSREDEEAFTDWQEDWPGEPEELVDWWLAGNDGAEELVVKAREQLEWYGEGRRDGVPDVDESSDADEDEEANEEAQEVYEQGEQLAATPSDEE